MASLSKNKNIGIEYARTECDSSEENEFEGCCVKTNPLKHKTELCKTYSQLGFCNYGDKCRFAHGKEELVHVPVNRDLRKRKCNGYWGKGYCSYGIRCQFGHHEHKSEDRLILQMAKGCFSSAPEQHPRLLRIMQGL